MMRVTFALAACLLAGSALAQSGAQVHASAATDAPRAPQPSRAAVDASAATDASKPPPPASATGEASAATDAARSAASSRASAATDAPQRLIPRARKTTQPAAALGKRAQ